MTADLDRRMALAREWDDLVARVRTMDGLGDFLHPPGLDQLLRVGQDGPVVVLNVSDQQCDALIIRTTGVRRVPLPRLSRASLDEEVGRYLATAGVQQMRGRRDASVDATVEPALERCLSWMWDTIAEPVLRHLGHTAPPQPDSAWPRVWWCPTGASSLLPIHAAGRHDEPGRAVLDRVVSSYTPTLRALLAARSAVPAGTGRMLFVGMPSTPGQDPLPNVARERALIEDLLPADRRTVLVEEDATRSAVLRELPGHSWVHFACHGRQNLDDPSHGALQLHDGPLSVTDLSEPQYRGELAYLSGCKTAVGGVRLADEAITLAAALNYTGYRNVIATLWSVWDEPAATVAEQVYARLRPRGVLDARGAARALHDAVRILRDEHPARPSLWTPFAHIGP